MTWKTYKTKKDNKINDNYTIPAGSIIEIDWDGSDGAWFKDSEGNVGCPWIDTDVEEVTEEIKIRTETFNQFVKRIMADDEALWMVLEDYFTSHPEYNEKTKRIEEVL